MVIIFVEYVCPLVKKIKYYKRITGLASQGKHTRATEHVKNLGNKFFR